MKAQLIIMAAPSGAGKNTFINKLLSEYENITHSISYTTRAPRDGERQGDPYHFVSVEEFERLIDENFFVEWERVHNNIYGTSRKQLEERWAENKWVVMDVDVKGAASLKSQYPEAVSFFILPPSIDELRRRLANRPKGATDDIELRLANAVDEMLSAPDFDYQITNDDFEIAYAEFKKIIDQIVNQ